MDSSMPRASFKFVWDTDAEEVYTKAWTVPTVFDASSRFRAPSTFTLQNISCCETVELGLAMWKTVLGFTLSKTAYTTTSVRQTFSCAGLCPHRVSLELLSFEYPVEERAWHRYAQWETCLDFITRRNITFMVSNTGYLVAYIPGKDMNLGTLFVLE